EPRGAVVAVHVAAVEALKRAVAHHVAADDRAEAGTVGADEHGRRVAGRRPSLEAAASLEVAPAEVAPGGRAARLEVDLLEAILPHVADGERAGGAVEREAPRIAQPVRVDLGPAAAAAERVAAWDPVAAARVRVDAQQFAEQGAEVLPRVRR